MAERLTMQEVIEHCDKATRLMERVFTCMHNGGEFAQIETKGYLEHKKTAEWLRELQKYKDLEEQGRLIIFPCVPDETVWVAHKRFGVIKTSFACYPDILSTMESGYQFAKTKEEAELKLAELKGEQE